MTNLSVSIPESAKRFVERQAEKGAYASPSAYVEALIQEAQARAEREELEQALLDGIDSPTSEMTADSWAHLRQRILDRHPGLRNG